MESLADLPAHPEPPDLGRVIAVLLIGESHDGRPLLTKIETADKIDMAVDTAFLQPRPGSELRATQEHFPTMRNLLNSLSLSLHKAALTCIEKKPEPVEAEKAPDVQPQEGQ